MDFNVKQI